MSTILDELTKYRLVLTEMDQPRREKCSGCGRDKMKKQLRPIKGKDGLYCQICHIPYGRKKEVKEDRTAITLPKKEMGREAYRRYLHNNPTVGNVDRLLELLNEYAEKINQLSMLGKSTEKYQIMMDKVEETIGSYPDGQQRLDDFWREYNDSFDDVYESTVVAESKCNFCHKPVELSPSAAARAKKFGGSASDYTKLFPNHSDCELANRKNDTSDLMARKRKENADSQVILKRTMKEAALLRWKASSVPTGRYRSFEKRTWPSAEYQDGSPAVQLICSEPYSTRVAEAGNLEIKIGVADHSDPSNKATGAGFTWKYLQKRAKFLSEAKLRATHFLQSHSNFGPKKPEPEAQTPPEKVVNEYVNPADLPEIEAESKGIELGKHNAMEELSEIVARIPANQVIPYAEFGKNLVGLHRTFKKGSDPMVVDFTRGWNSILQKVNEILPKSRTRHLTKDELQSVITFVGEKELNWN